MENLTTCAQGRTLVSSKRDKTLDIMKGIGIILMVLGHSGVPFHDFIYLFHMTVFFMISGYLWNDKKVQDLKGLWHFFLSRLKGLLLPYALCNGIFTLLNNPFVSWHINPDHCTKLTLQQTAVNLFKNMLFAGDTSMGGATWFLRTLFFVYIAHGVVRFVANKLKYGNVFFGAVIVLCVAGTVVIDRTRIALPMGISSCFSAYLAFLLGMLVRKQAWIAKIKRFDIAIAIVCFGILALLSPYGPIGIGVGSIVNLGLFILAAFLGWFMLYCTSRCIRGWLAEMLSYCGKHSIWIVTLHFLAFKPVALSYLLLTGKSLQLLSQHPVYAVSWLWPVYTVAGTGLPLLLCHLWHTLTSRCKTILQKKKNN